MRVNSGKILCLSVYKDNTDVTGLRVNDGSRSNQQALTSPLRHHVIEGLAPVVKKKTTEIVSIFSIYFL